jgi:CBS domain-containing protein
MPTIDEFLVSHICTPAPIVLSEEMSFGDAYEALVGEGISAVPVTSAEGDLIGVVSASDLLVILGPLLDSQEDTPDSAELARVKASALTEHVQGPPLTCTESTSLREACALMVREGVHRLVVIAADEVVGVISSMDVVRAVALSDEAACP